MVRICDALPGAGKSSSCINYMNEHPDEKFIYITPYLPESLRIRDGCPGKRFYYPTRANADAYHSKTLDTLEKLKEGRNITTTHAAFLFYTPEIIDVIKQQGYILMVDESVNILEEMKMDAGDFDVLVEAGYVIKEDDKYTMGKPGYAGSYFAKAMRVLRSRELVHLGGDQYKDNYYYWMLPMNFLLAFKDVIIMTYLFEGQDMCNYMKMCGVPYQYIGIREDETGYHFDEALTECPRNMAREAELKNKIHIFDVPKVNAIGDNRNALSMNWFATNKKGVQQLKRNVRNFFRNYMKDHPASERLFGTYKDNADDIREKGYTDSYLVFNSRATNDYADKKVLAYCCNLFMDGGRKSFFMRHGAPINEDLCALSTMVQWIFRSAIRRGEEIWIYIPSRRMRELLQGWLDGLASGSGVHAPDGVGEVRVG